MLCCGVEEHLPWSMQVYSAEPILGVQFTVENVAKPLKDMTIYRK